MSNFSTSYNEPLVPGNYRETALKTDSSAFSPTGYFDSGISDVYVSGPVVERGENLGHTYNRPKFTFQGSLDDVENGDSGIMMGEEETFTDSARSHRNTAVVMEKSSPAVSRPRSVSPKSMSSDEEASKPSLIVVRERSSNSKRKGPRIPRKIVTSSSVGSDLVPAKPLKSENRSASANTVSQAELASCPSTAKSSPSLLQEPELLAARGNLDNSSFYSISSGYPSIGQQRVPPLASDYSMSMTNLQKYMDLFLPDKDGDTGFHMAVVHGQMDVLEGLLFIASHDRSLQAVVNEQNALYQSPLHLAVHTQQPDMIRKLLIAGATIDLSDHKGNTPLHIACRFSSTRVLDEMVHYVPLPAVLKAALTRNNEGLSCVHVAAKNGNTEILAKLKNLGIDMDMQDLNCGRTALHIAVEKSSLADVQCLLETCEADVNRVTYSGCSPLHIAAGRGDIAIVAYLISMGANPELLTDEGDLALDLSGSDQVLSFLKRVASLKWLY